MKNRILFLIALLILSGCATVYGPISGKPYWKIWGEIISHEYVDYYRELYVYNHPELSAEVKRCILQGKVRMGMTEEQVRYSIAYKPDRVNRSVHSNYVFTQWVYGDTYFYFENGILTSWQD